ncbi:MAG: ABC transporter permease subunit [Luteitalea sp.]|nr:ABC transporter permease subunit [Luteitalea sp.]
MTMRGLQATQAAVLALAGTAFAVCCVLPLAYMVWRSLASAPQGGAPVVAALLLDARQRELLANSTLLGAGTALGATLIGAPLGVALARVALPFKGVLRVALIAPLLLPPYVMGLAWLYLGGSAGLVARMVGRDVLSPWTYSLAGATFVLALVFFPLSMLATEVALRRVDGRSEEAALMVARPGRVLWRITLPLAAPAITAAALLIFVLAISEFGVPGLLRVRVFTTEVFTAFAALYDFNRATILALPLLVVSVLVTAVAAVLVGERLIVTRRGTRAGRPVSFDAWRRFAIVASMCVLLLALVVPLAVLAYEASGVRSFAAIVRGSREAITNSLMLATIGASLVVTIAVWLGYTRARVSRGLGRIADVLWVVLFATPSTVIGVGLIGLWNQPGMVGAVYGTDAMLVLAYLARFVPVAALVLGASVRHVPASHEEAAAVGGAGWLRAMTFIVLPQIRLGILTAWTIAFILAFGELGASILVAPPGATTLPIRIYTIIANTPPAQVAALALLQSAVVFVPLAALGLGVAVREVR